MKTDKKEILKNNNLARLCRKIWLDENGIPKSSAFQKRIYNNGNIEEYLSVQWLEYFKECCRIHKAYLAMISSGLKDNGKDSIIVLLSDNIYENCKDNSIKVAIRQTAKNTSHCGIYHSYDNIKFSELMAEKCCSKENIKLISEIKKINSD